MGIIGLWVCITAADAHRLFADRQSPCILCSVSKTNARLKEVTEPRVMGMFTFRPLYL